MIGQGKPIGAICISPATLTLAAGSLSPEVTIGQDVNTAAAIEKLGGKHVASPVDGVVVDRKNKFVTTPAYMLGPGIKDVAAGIEKLVGEVLSLS